MERTVYQSFEIDSATNIEFKLVGDFELIKWAGNSILTETNIQIWKASPRILDFFIEQGRYEILSSKDIASPLLSSRFLERQPIKTKEGECVEIIKLKIFVPDIFEWTADDKNHLKKKVEAAAAPDVAPIGNSNR